MKKKSFIFVRERPEFTVEGLKKDVMYDQVIRWRLQRFGTQDGFGLVDLHMVFGYFGPMLMFELNKRTGLMSCLSSPLFSLSTRK